MFLIVHRAHMMADEKETGETCIALDKPDTENATYFLADENVDDGDYWLADFLYLKKQTHYAYLKEINEGRKNGPRWHNDPLITYESARDLIGTLSGHLDMTTTQRHRARRYFVALDRERLGLSLELVAYCLCAYTVEQDEQNRHRRCHPNVLKEERDEQFQWVANSLGLAERDIQKTYGKLQHRLKDAPLPPVEMDRRDPDHYPGGGT